MKKLLAAMFVALLMFGCGEDAQNKAVQNEAKIDLDDNETRNRIIAEAIESRYVDDVSTEDGKRLYRVPDKFELVEDLRAGKISREELSVLQSKTELFTGWCKRFYPNGQLVRVVGKVGMLKIHDGGFAFLGEVVEYLVPIFATMEAG